MPVITPITEMPSIAKVGLVEGDNGKNRKWRALQLAIIFSNATSNIKTENMIDPVK